MTDSKKLLLVDDEADILRATQLRLSLAGFETLLARDGVEAIESAVENRPDAIVMDVRMPRKDGLTALAELRQQTETQHVPIVILSASLIDKERALDAGATYFLTKPYQGRELVEVVNAAISKADTLAAAP